MREVKVVQNADEPIGVEVLAKSILNLEAAARKLAECGLTTRAIALLVHDYLPTANCPTRAQIHAVLEALPQLSKIYIKKSTK